MIEDPIVEEIRRHRRTHVAEHGNDLGRIAQALRKHERGIYSYSVESGAKVELPRFRGHIRSEAEGGGNDAEDTSTVRA